MHRSGTSATAGVLKRVGVELGSELLPPQPDNPKGFFEHARIIRLHDEVLSIFDATWDDPRSLPERWEQDPRLASPRQRLKVILRRTFAERPLWGIKDPRLCRLLPFWMPVLHELNVSAKAVLVVRNPAETSASLRRRNGMMPEHAAMLWLSHVLASERHSRELPRVVMLYDDLMRDWASEVQRASDVIGIDLFAFSENIKDDVTNFLESELWHYNKTDAPPLSAPQNLWVIKTYDAMVRWRREAVLPTPVCDQAFEALAQGELAAQPISTYLRVRFSSEGAALRAGQAAKEAERAAVQQDLAAARQELAAAQQELAAAQQELAAVRQELAAAQQELAAAQQELLAARQERTARSSELAALRDVHNDATQWIRDAESRERTTSIAASDALARLVELRRSKAWRLARTLWYIRTQLKSRGKTGAVVAVSQLLWRLLHVSHSLPAHDQVFDIIQLIESRFGPVNNQADH